jgi:hypothetical protein
LSPSERKAVESLSSRSIVTSYHADFTYHYGDFRADLEKILTKYFDIMFYISSFGCTQIMFRIPKGLVNIKELTEYGVPDVITIKLAKKIIIVDIFINEEEGGGWVTEDNWLDQLVDLRDALIMGDYRVLYLAWLKATEDTEYYPDIQHPTVPHNLSKLNPSLKSFIEIFNVGSDLVKEAVKKSKIADVASFVIDSEKMIKKLPVAEKNDFLNKFFNGEPHLKVKLKNRILEL